VKYLSSIPQVGEIEQRIMVFSKAFQDLIGQMMKEKQEKQQLIKEIEIIREELAKLKIEVKSTKTLTKKEKINRKYKKAKEKLETSTGSVSS